MYTQYIKESDLYCFPLSCYIWMLKIIFKRVYMIPLSTKAGKINQHIFIDTYTHKDENINTKSLRRGWKEGSTQGWGKVYSVQWMIAMSSLCTSVSSKHSLGKISLSKGLWGQRGQSYFHNKTKTQFAFCNLILARMYDSFPVIHDMWLSKQTKLKRSYWNPSVFYEATH